MSDPAMELTPAESEALAWRLTARLLADGDLIEWGDVPELSEAAWERLDDSMALVARNVRLIGDILIIGRGIDPHDLLRRAS